MRLFEERHGNVSYQSPYFLYANSLRSKVKAANRTACFRDIAKICSKKFDDLPQEELDYWYQQGSADKKSYLREMADPTNTWSPLFLEKTLGGDDEMYESGFQEQEECCIS